MTTKIKKKSIKMSIVAVAFLFACGGRSQPPILTIIGNEHTSSETTAALISESRETNSIEASIPASPENSENNIDADDRPRNTEWADKNGNPRYGYFDVYGKRHTQHYELIHEKPMFKGNEFLEEWEKYSDTNNKFQKIMEENNIQEARISFEIIINTDGSIDAKIRKENTNQELGDEFLRQINNMQEHGKIAPGKHDGKVMNARIPIISYKYVATQ